MNWFRRFMMGRYGYDQLSMALLILSVLMTFIASLINRPLLSYLGYIPLGLSIFRIWSRNVQRRRMENYKFTMIISPIYTWFKKTQNRAVDSKTHRHFKCPKCGQGLRVPKGKGKLIVTCPKCKMEFKART